MGGGSRQVGHTHTTTEANRHQIMEMGGAREISAQYLSSRRMGGDNALHDAASSGTVAKVKELLASADGQKMAMEKESVSEDTAHNPSQLLSFFSPFSVSCSLKRENPRKDV